MPRRDDEAYVEFVDGASRALRRTAYLVCGDWQQAEDLVQDALLKLYVAWPRVARSEGVHAYARRTVVIDGLRALPARARACVVLRYFDDLSVEETARVLGVTSGTVKSQTSRGLELLRATFERAGIALDLVGGDTA